MPHSSMKDVPNRSCPTTSVSSSEEASTSLPSGSEASTISSRKAVKRKRKVLMIQQKKEIVMVLSRGVSATILSGW